MEIKAKEQKIRDRIIYAFNVIPTLVDVDRRVVYVEIRKEDVERLSISVEEMAVDLTTLLDREVDVNVK